MVDVFEEVWNNFKNIIFESIERFVPHKVLRKTSDPEYNNKQVKRLKLKVRKAYNRRKSGQQYREELKGLSKRLLLAKKCTGDILRSILKNEGTCWTEFCKYVKRRKGNREDIPAIKHGNGRPITDSIEKANSLNFYYSSAFSCERNIPQVQCANSGETFAISTKVISKRLAAIGKNKSTGLDSVSGEILKLGGESMIPYLARLLDITINNAIIPSD
jgi:hypothetical protein